MWKKDGGVKHKADAHHHIVVTLTSWVKSNQISHVMMKTTHEESHDEDELFFSLT